MFDYEQIHKIIDKMNESSLSEINIENGTYKISMKKGTENGIPVVVGGEPVKTIFDVPQIENNIKENTENATKKVEGKNDEVKTSKGNLSTITSPMVGTFYASANPDSPAFVKEGDSVKEGSTVCIIEAMKMFNEIESDVSGKIVDILVENGEVVEYGQDIFVIERDDV